MEKMQFKCELLSDVILSQTAASEGNRNSLDFIPGNNFLGIAASRLYGKNEEVDDLAVFHTGKVRFGDAHPSPEGGPRGLKVPGAMFYPKLKKASEECYIHHCIPHPESPEITALQLKQCREGFYAFGDGNRGLPVSFDKNFAIKSAYDSQNRRSKDGQLFGYQSLPANLLLYFEIESDLDEPTNQKIREALTGTVHIGRSRTAQYGLARIEPHPFDEVPSTGECFTREGDTYATVYADGRLIFLDENGEPTFMPDAEKLGFRPEHNAKIDWSKSQIRTFQYSPWNGKRKSYDTDRCGIEKGSVFVVKCTASPAESAYIGSYRNEGFGKVIYNPAFLSGNADGKALYTLAEKPDTLAEKPDALSNPEPAAETPTATETLSEPLRSSGETLTGTETTPAAETLSNPLLSFLAQQKKRAEDTRKLYQQVQDFIREHSFKFEGLQFASQWGSIRNIALIEPDETKIPERIDGFLGHGVARGKWEEAGRKAALEEFMNVAEAQSILRDAVVNLASEMAKKCKKEE